MNIAENIGINIYVLKTNRRIKNYDVIGKEVNMNSQKLRRIVNKKQSPKICEVEALANFSVYLLLI